MRYVEVEWFIRPDGTRQASPWPDYPRSLDAMHEELATVKDQDQRKRWMDHLWRIIGNPMHSVPDHVLIECMWHAAHPEAWASCLAFILTHDPEFTL